MLRCLNAERKSACLQAFRLPNRSMSPPCSSRCVRRFGGRAGMPAQATAKPAIGAPPPPKPTVSGPCRRAARAEAERLWPVSADRGLRLRPGWRGGIGTPVKWVLRKGMRWYVEPLAYDQRSFNAAMLRLVDDLQARIDELERELEAARAASHP